MGWTKIFDGAQGLGCQCNESGRGHSSRQLSCAHWERTLRLQVIIFSISGSRGITRWLFSSSLITLYVSSSLKLICLESKSLIRSKNRERLGRCGEFIAYISFPDHEASRSAEPRVSYLWANDLIIFFILDLILNIFFTLFIWPYIISIIVKQMSSYVCNTWDLGCLFWFIDAVIWLANKPHIFTDYLTFREHQKKVKVEFMENNTRVLYRNKRTYFYDANASCASCSLDDLVTIPNVIFQVHPTMQNFYSSFRGDKIWCTGVILIHWFEIFCNNIVYLQYFDIVPFTIWHWWYFRIKFLIYFFPFSLISPCLLSKSILSSSDYVLYYFITINRNPVIYCRGRRRPVIRDYVSYYIFIMFIFILFIITTFDCSSPCILFLYWINFLFVRTVVLLGSSYGIQSSQIQINGPNVLTPLIYT